VVVANRGTSEILGVGEVVELGYVWEGDRERYRNTARVDWKEGTGRTIPTREALGAGHRGADPGGAVCADELATGWGPDAQVHGDSAAPLFAELQEALDCKGQAILYGPPGTGKTYQARRFAVWTLLRSQGRTDVEAVIADPRRFAAEEKRLTTVQVARRVWWVVANPSQSQWSWDELRKNSTVEYRYG
jgi:5-methylcytosine-specific restriction enzyme B